MCIAFDHHFEAFLAASPGESIGYDSAIQAVSSHLFSVNTVTLTQTRRVQDRYANGFMEFKPDKKLHWLPQLGTITLELELQDRTIETEVTPLEAALIGLFEEKGAFLSLFEWLVRVRGYSAGNWTTDDLISSVGGAVEKSTMTKALNKWVNLGIIKEEEGGEFVLLEMQEEGSVKPSASRQGTFVVDSLCRISLLTTD